MRHPSLGDGALLPLVLEKKVLAPVELQQLGIATMLDLAGAFDSAQEVRSVGPYH